MNIVRSYREYKADANLSRTLWTVFRVLEWPRVTPGEKMSRSGKLPGRVLLDAVDIERLAEPYRRKDGTGLIVIHMLAELVMMRPSFRQFQDDVRGHHHVDVDYDRTNYCFYLKPVRPFDRQNRL